MGCGVVFKVDPTGNETTLYSFPGGTAGQYPFGGLVRDANGNLYSTTTEGGDVSGGDCSCGVVFKLDQTGTETVLHEFSGTDGAEPAGSLVLYNGYLYGTTLGGGTGLRGVAYKLRP